MHPRKQPIIGARHPVELTVEQIEALALFTRHLAGYDPHSTAHGQCRDRKGPQRYSDFQTDP